MKKILLPLLLVCGAWLAGCVATSAASTSSTHKTLRVGTGVVPAPIVADLIVSDQKVRGEATGSALDAELLKREAVIKALRQDPPTVEGPDVLVGREVYTETANGFMKVVVTGYPAWYRNFRNAPEDSNESAWLVITGQNDIQKTEGN